MGKMNEIKELLQSGKSVKEIVELGYKKPSIYKVKKQMKEDNEEKIVKGNKEKESFQDDTLPKETPEEILDDLTTEPDNPVPDTSNDPVDEEKEEPESITEETFDGKSKDFHKEKSDDIEIEDFSDDAVPFREFGGINISRDNIDVTPILTDTKLSTQKDSAKTGSVGVTELLTEVFGTIGILTDHDFWDLSKKDQKVLKHLCKLPGLEKFLHKFGLYGCVFGLFTITFKRIKMEIKLKKIPDKSPEVQINPALPFSGQTDMPSSILEGVPE